MQYNPSNEHSTSTIIFLAIRFKSHCFFGLFKLRDNGIWNEFWSIRSNAIVPRVQRIQNVKQKKEKKEW